MVDRAGNPHEIPLAEIPRAQQLGFMPEPTEAAIARIDREYRAEQASGVLPTATAGVFGALRGVTLGGSDVLVGALGGREHLAEMKEHHPTAGIVGEVVGAVATGGTSLLAKAPAGAAARLGARIARVEEGASAATKLGRGFAGGAAEGMITGAGQGISELAITDKKLTAELIASTLSSSMATGGVVGAGAGTFAKAAEIGLGRAKRAIDDFAATRAARANVPDDLAGLDAKGLRAAETTELEAIGVARAPERAQLADDISQHRTAMKNEKVWIATVGAADREAKEIGKISLEADKYLDRVLRNPKALAEDPGAALKALQQQEHALERLAARGADDAAQPLTHAEGGALFRYQGGGYLDIQDYARTGKRSRGSSFANAAEAKKTIGELDGAIAKGRTADDEILYRGISEEGSRRAGITGEFKVGGVIRDKGYSSASRSMDSAAEFSSKVGGRPMLLEIEVPKGSRAASIAPDGSLSESEMLLGRGSGFEVTAMRIEQVAGQEMRIARVRYLDPDANLSARGAALAKVPATLERNRALQTRIGELAADPRSARLEAIAAAREALSEKGEKSIAEQMLQGSVFSGAAGLASMVPVIGPLIAPFVGAKASKLVGEQVFGRLGKSAGEATTRVAKAVGSFLGKAEKVAGKIAPIAPPLATRVLAAVRYAPERDKPADAKKQTNAKQTLPQLYLARSQEIRSQTAYGPDGRAVMRPDARAQIAETLKPIAAVNPILADQMETIAARKIEMLANALPRKPDILAAQNGGPDLWRPCDMAMRSWARLAAAAEDPIGALERASAGMVTSEDARVMREVYPEMLADFTRQVLEQLPTLETPLPYPRRLALSVLTGMPIDPAMDPRILRTLQAQFSTEEGSEGGTQAPRAAPQFGSLGTSKVADQDATPAQRRSA